MAHRLLYSVLDTYHRPPVVRDKRRPLVARDDRPTMRQPAKTVLCRYCGVVTGNVTDAVCLACERGKWEAAAEALHEVVEHCPSGVTLKGVDGAVREADRRCRPVGRVSTSIAA